VIGPKIGDVDIDFGHDSNVRLAAEGLTLSMLLDLAVPRRSEVLAELTSALENLAIPVDGRTET
jgi:hypothetical protein